MLRIFFYLIVVLCVAYVLAAESALAETKVIQGELAEGDKVHKDRESFVDYYEMDVSSGNLMTVTMVSTEDDGFDTYLYVTGPSGQELSNDDSSEVDGSQLIFVVTETGPWEISATGYEDAKGAYKLGIRTQKLTRLLSERGELGTDSKKLMKYGEFYDLHTVPVEAGKTYAAIAVSSDIDTFLSVHFPGGLVTNDSAPSDYNKSLAIFKPSKAGEAKVIMTSSDAEEEGRYRLYVYQAADE